MGSTSLPPEQALDGGYNRSYTFGMKTAISIPDPLFEAADQVAKELAISRSELYSKAVAEFVAAHSGDSITEKLNEVLANEPNELDPVLVEMQMRVLRNDPW